MKTLYKRMFLFAWFLLCFPAIPTCATQTENPQPSHSNVDVTVAEALNTCMTTAMFFGFLGIITPKLNPDCVAEKAKFHRTEEQHHAHVGLYDRAKFHRTVAEKLEAQVEQLSSPKK